MPKPRVALFQDPQPKLVPSPKPPQFFFIDASTHPLWNHPEVRPKEKEEHKVDTEGGHCGETGDNEAGGTQEGPDLE